MKRDDITWYGTLVAGVVAGATTLWWIGDFTGLRPVYKKEFYDTISLGQESQNQSTLFVRWLYLKDKAKSHTIETDEQGELCGIAGRLHLTTESCK